MPVNANCSFGETDQAKYDYELLRSRWIYIYMYVSENELPAVIDNWWTVFITLSESIFIPLQQYLEIDQNMPMMILKQAWLIYARKEDNVKHIHLNS